MIDKQVQDNYDKLAKTGLQIIHKNYLQFIFYCRYLHPETLHFRDFLLQKYMKGVLFDGKNGKIN